VNEEEIMFGFLPERRRAYDLFDDIFDDAFTAPFFTSNRNNDIMRTDISEKDGNYLLNVALPGYKKEDIKLSLKNGNLIIEAGRNETNEEKDAKGNIIRQERYSGSASRSFYVGENIKEEDIKASFENGELHLTVPNTKAVEHQPEEQKYIAID
jgi:HSP20 family molecular chaperone IbpA